MLRLLTTLCVLGILQSCMPLNKNHNSQ